MSHPTPSPAVGFFLRLTRVLALALGMLAPWTLAQANAPLVAPADWRYGVWVDATASHGIEAVAALPAEAWLQRQGPYAAGYRPQAHWLRLDWPGHLPPDQPYWLEIWPAFLDHVDLYQWQQGRWQQQSLGDLRPRQGRVFDHRHFVAQLHPDRSQPLYLRVQTSSTTLVMAALWTPDAFITHATHDALFWGAYFGVALVAMAMVIGLAAYLRNAKLASIGAFVLGFLLVASNQGYLSWLVFPRQIAWGHHLSGLLVLWSQAASLWLIARSLDLHQHHPRLHRLYQAATGLLLLASAAVPLGAYPHMIGGLFLMTTLLQLGSIWIGWRLWRRLHSYGLVTLGYALYSVSSLMAVATVTGWLPFHRLLFEFWQYALTLLMVGIAYFSLKQVRDDHLRHLSEATSRLLATDEARTLLARQVAQHTRELEQTRDALQVSLINEQEARLQERQFIGMLSHEFRTPLAIVNSALEVIDFTGPDDPARQAECLQHIRSANQRLVQLTDTCLADARLERGLSQIDWQPFDWTALISSAAEQLGLSMAQGELRLHNETLPGAPGPQGDEGLLRILLSNLLDNARKFSALQPVDLWLQEDRSGWRLRVIDRGPGIPEADWERIFERFVRLPDTRALEGSGLGLYVCRQIARAHGGDVRVLNARSGLTTLEFRLPRQRTGTPP